MEEACTFLGTEVKVQQQRVLLQCQTYTEHDKNNDKNRFRGGSSHQNLAHQKQGNAPTCFFCDGKCSHEHVSSKGPGGSMVIQYFACKDFADKTPGERLATLKKKGLCHQCLLPGAKLQDIKHKHGQCQRDFICRHLSHQQYSVKHHVLVCEDHKTIKENEDLLAEFKTRFINRNLSLPNFSRDIRLSFFTASGESHNDEVGIYQLQNIVVNNKVFARGELIEIDGELGVRLVQITGA